MVCKSIIIRNGGIRWPLPSHIVWNGPILLCRCNQENTALKDFFILHSLPSSQITFRENDLSLRECKSATNLPSLFENEPAEVLLKVLSSPTIHSPANQRRFGQR